MKKKLKSFFSNNKYIMISGAAALFIILLVYFCYEIIPFGNKTVYRMDLYHQYGPLFSELYDRLTSGSSLIYSWNSGLGSSFLGNFFNYLSSPISLIILLFGHKNTFEAIAAMIAIKAVLSSMSMSYYLKKSKGENSLVISAFGIMYAFCGYFIAYYWNIMWIDAMYLLPFIALGIERIIDSGKTRTYFFALVLTIFSNYYIGYILCIFSCIYFIYYYVCSLNKIKVRNKNIEIKGTLSKIKNSFFLHSGIKFALSSISAGMVLLFMLVPLVSILQSSSATGSNAPTEYKFYFNIFDFLANHLASLEPTIRSSGEDILPNIYCGILTVLLIPLYMFSKRIPYYEKIASVVLLAVMYFSFNLNYLNFAWHGFHFPNDLPYRQSFIYSFILITLAFKAFKNIEEYDKKHILAAGLAVLSFIIIAEKVGSKNVTDGTVYISIIFVVLLTVVLGLIVSKKNQAFALSVMLICSVAAETISASTDHYVANQTKDSYSADYDDFKSLQSTVAESDDSLFYREELSDLRARMDPSWYGYNGASIFSSMAYEKVANVQKQIGLFGNYINSFTYNPQTPIYNSFFSLKYIYDKKNRLSEGDYYTFKSSNETFTAYENKYMLNIAFPVSSAVTDWTASTYDNPVDAQNELFRLTTGIENVISKITDYDVIYGNVLQIDQSGIDTGTFTLNKISNDYHGSVTVEITAVNDENIYIYVYSKNLDTVQAYSPVNSMTMNVSDGYILDLGKHSQGTVLSVELPIKDSENSANVDFIAFTIDKTKFENGYNSLQNGQIEYTDFNDTCIKGTFTAESNEILFTSIPYDKYWNVYIDGKRISNDDIIKISDAFIGVKVTDGTHKITFNYSSQVIKGAIFVSAFYSIILLILYILKSRKMLFYKKLKPNLWERTDIKNAVSETETAIVNTDEETIQESPNIENEEEIIIFEDNSNDADK